ncbi:MAG: thiamine phosphate synthase [Actinobacteria bacterium]|nr:thiamine phosphate synthase [Actinomycetota bacterium]
MTALTGLLARLRLARTLVTIDTRHHDVAAFAAALFAQGADIVELRDPHAPLAALRTAVEAAQRVAMPLNKLVAVSGDIEVARAVMADVLVGGPDLDPGLAHARLHEYALVGLPASTADDCRHLAESDAVDFALVGPVTLSSGTAGAEADLDLVRVAARQMPLGEVTATPWFALVDSSGSRLAEVVAAGARRAGVMVTGEKDLPLVGRVAETLRHAWQADPALEDFALRVLSNPGPPARFRTAPEPTTW